MLLLLGLFAAGVLEVTDRGSEGVRMGRAHSNARALTDLGLTRAAWVLKTGTEGARARPLRADGLAWTDSLPSGRVAIRITPADSLVDINLAGDPVLRDLAHMIARKSGDPEAAPDIAAALAEARGRHSSVLSVAEVIGGVLGTRAQMADIATVLTVGGGGSVPDLSRAPEALLRGLFQMTPEALAEVLARRREAGPAPLPQYAYPDPETAADPLSPPRGPVWHVSVAAQTGAAGRAGRAWVIFLPLPEMRADQPYFVLESWQLSPEDELFHALRPADENRSP
ncbi:hypothetical protein [uncultured Roseobacter sp.]|uniref:hypothetical protein n=1 Tax=uncultured Roseobacter sp. TaxID=114847 RepID=UPI0026224A45|nr:hypothetical protein [uncultured Roseobacter sp.]